MLAECMVLTKLASLNLGLTLVVSVDTALALASASGHECCDS